jgi:DNA-binding transcriptional LysR family regulator
VILSYPDLMIEAAVDGLGVAYVLEHEVAAHIATARLVSILENQTPPFFCFLLAYPSRKQVSSLLTAFLPRL